MKYIASEIKNASGVSLLLEKAIIKATNTPLLLSVLIEGENEKEKQLLRDMGAWFQNEAVRNLADRISKASHSKNEMYSFIEDYFDNSCRYLKDKCMKDISLVFCIDDNAYLSGDDAYLIQHQFGKPVSVPATAYEDGNIKLMEGATILLTNGESDIIDDKDCLDCLMSANSDDSLKRAVREVAEIYPSALICIKAF